MAIIRGPGAKSIGKPWVNFTSPQRSRYTISGVTRDNAGNPLGGCTVEVYETVSNLWRGTTISDANGNYAVEIAGDRTMAFQAVATSPDGTMIGATVNTLTAA